MENFSLLLAVISPSGFVKQLDPGFCCQRDQEKIFSFPLSLEGGEFET